MSIIQCKNISFSYDGKAEPIFEHVDLMLDSDWKLGLIGRNGKGKTTLLKILMEELEYTGEIITKTPFVYFPYPIQDEEKTGLQIYHTICKEHEDWELDVELAKLELDYDLLERAFSTFSQGEKTKVLLACLFIREDVFLLLDEPTNHLDRETRETIGAYLETKKGFILVSHDRSLLDRCCDHILSIEKETIVLQNGNYEVWRENKEAQDEFERKEQEKAKKEIKKLSQAAERSKRWANQAEKEKMRKEPNEKIDRGFMSHKAAKGMKRMKNIEKRKEEQLEKKKRLLKNVESIEKIKIETLAHPAKILVSCKAVQIGYDRPLFKEPISFAIEKKDRVALIGKNGSGKTSLIHVILKKMPLKRGEIVYAPHLKISTLSQDLKELKGSIPELVEQAQIDGTLFRTLLIKLGFSREEFDQRIEWMSKGQQKKIGIAKSLCQKAHLYIWDEPLNDLDLFARMQLEAMILQFEPTLLFVEHDPVFLEQIATKTILL